MNIYSKKGDKGYSSIYNKRLAKSDIVFEALGKLDEISVLIGIFISSYKVRKEDIDYLQITQRTLFKINSLIAGYQVVIDLAKETNLLEKEIDILDAKNLPLANFILPVGTKESSFLHLIRVKIREAERILVKLQADKKILSYINRLSDYFFVIARNYNDYGKKDILL